MHEHNGDAIQLICLDLGGVMIRICGGWEEACRRAGIAFPARLADPAIWMTLQDIGNQHECGLIQDDAFAQQTGQLIDTPPQHVLAGCDAWLKGPYPGAVELIGELSRHGQVRSACLSNTNTRHWRMMTTPGPHFLGLDRLTWRFTSFEARMMKPSPGIFRQVEQATGIAGRAILFFDDSQANVHTAQQRGWQAVRIDPAGDPVAQIRGQLKVRALLD
ncbi:MAG: HAD-IA family hydrolase [Phycisphaeraceae bacterium]